MNNELEFNVCFVFGKRRLGWFRQKEHLCSKVSPGAFSDICPTIFLLAMGDIKLLVFQSFTVHQTRSMCVWYVVLLSAVRLSLGARVCTDKKWVCTDIKWDCRD